ncbi:MAG: nucleotidyltransferase domain-containing protein [Nitrospirae bacterium]|nr:nucleotidyltransferase domain-containing protein [Nitrospirota bacterium]
MKSVCLDVVKTAVIGFLKNDDVEVMLFGSRARGDNNAASDIDIAVLPGGGFDKRRLTLLRDYLEELNVPYKIEIVDLSKTSEDFKEEVFRYAQVWKESLSGIRAL